MSADDFFLKFKVPSNPAPPTPPKQPVAVTRPPALQPVVTPAPVTGSQSLDAAALASAIKEYVDDKDASHYLNQVPSLFNILHGMGKASEIRYSNFLSWLLNPLENHGLGDLFARLLIEKLIKDKEPKRRFREVLPLNPDDQFSNYQLVDYPVDRRSNKQPLVKNSKTEALGKSIDIVYRNDETGIALVIENKTEGSNLHLSNFTTGNDTSKEVEIKAAEVTKIEGEDRGYTKDGKEVVVQLRKYFEVLCPQLGAPESVRKSFQFEADGVRALPKIFIFLTPHGDTVAENLDKAGLGEWINETALWFNAWIPISYDYLDDILKACIDALYNKEAATKHDPEGEYRQIHHARIAIQDFRGDAHRRWDEGMDQRVKETLGIKQNPKTDIGELGREMIAALLYRDLGIDDEVASAAKGSYLAQYRKLSNDDAVAAFGEELAKELEKLNVPPNKADIVIRDIFWAHKPIVRASDNEANPEVQNLVAKIGPLLHNLGYAVEGSGGGKFGGQALHFNVTEPCHKHSALKGQIKRIGWLDVNGAAKDSKYPSKSWIRDHGGPLLNEKGNVPGKVISGSKTQPQRPIEQWYDTNGNIAIEPLRELQRFINRLATEMGR